jgi:hypothetical protein
MKRGEHEGLLVILQFDYRECNTDEPRRRQSQRSNV